MTAPFHPFWLQSVSSTCDFLPPPLVLPVILRILAEITPTPAAFHLPRTGTVCKALVWNCFGRHEFLTFRYVLLKKKSVEFNCGIFVTVPHLPRSTSHGIVGYIFFYLDF